MAIAEAEDRRWKSDLTARLAYDVLSKDKILKIITNEEDDDEVDEDGQPLEELGSDEGFSAEEIAYMESVSRSLLDKGYSVEEY